MLRLWFKRQEVRFTNSYTNTSNASLGVLLLLLGIFFMSCMDALAKVLLQNDTHAIQILFIRTLIICPALYFFYRARGNAKTLKPVRWKAQLIRGCLGFLAPFCFFSALKYLPLTNVNVVFYSGTLMITVMSAFILRETVGPYRWGAVVVGYIGVVVAIGVQGGDNLLGYLLVIISSITYAGLFISGKWLSSTESSASLVLFYNVGVGLVSMLFIPAIWQSLNVQELLGIAAVALLAVLGHSCMTKAYTIADASMLAPLDYTSLLWAVSFDLLIWHAIPSVQTLIGACIIISSSLFLLYRERQNQIAAKQ